MPAKKKLLLVFGTRPETIKFASLFKALNAKEATFDVKVAVTGQHREMLDQALHIFRIHPDFDLNVIKPNQDLFDVSVAALTGLKTVLNHYDPDCVLVQGDTTTTFIASLSAFYTKAKVAHIEAGLRTFHKYRPYPEEINRKLTSCIADYHFAPTERAKRNLIQEGYSHTDITVTGNTSIDALLWVIRTTTPSFDDRFPRISADFLKSRFILLTTHRRENFGKPMEDSLLAVRDIVRANRGINVIMPVHFNPNVRAKVDHILRGEPNVVLTEPMDYVTFCHLMNLSYLVLTDSGGIQEEAPTLGKPVLVLRETTERPEGVDAGTAKLVGTNRQLILEETTRLLNDKEYYKRMAGAVNPYGDGTAGQQIADALEERL